jgi:hypothetical protein
LPDQLFRGLKLAIYAYFAILFFLLVFGRRVAHPNEMRKLWPASHKRRVPFVKMREQF